MNLMFEIIEAFLCFSSVQGYIEEPGPRFPPTKGEIWPRPSYQIKNDSYFVLQPTDFEIKLTLRDNCSLLQEAATRYEGYIKNSFKTVTKEKKDEDKIWENDVDFLGNLDTLEVILSHTCDNLKYPTPDIAELYTLTISESAARLNSSSAWGILRGLESFYQSIYLSADYSYLRINKTFVDDIPRFSHRGLLLDTSRHYIPLEKILLTLDAMAQNKLNVFHWHIVDDQSFPYVSKKFPELSDKGAFSPLHVYTPADVQTVIEYARLRGIRVIPEFDTPGHTRSWGVAHPEILTACEGAYSGKYGPMDPTKNVTYDFMNKLLGEIKEVFPDEYIHLGGDEVGFECWMSNSNITAFMQENNMHDYNALESYYVQKIIDMVDNLTYKSIVWEEVFNNGVKIPKETVVHVWTGLWEETMEEATLNGYNTILSSCWYLDHLEGGGDWEKFYYCEPYSFSQNPILRSRVIGGEACMWAEVVDANNVISRVWPRASAAAERLWDAELESIDIDEVRSRLEEHACRMNRRGIGAQPPNGPGFCL